MIKLFGGRSPAAITPSAAPEPLRFLDRPWIFVNFTGATVSVAYEGQSVSVPSLVGPDPSDLYFADLRAGVRQHLDRLAGNGQFRDHIRSGALVLYIGGMDTGFGLALADELGDFCRRIGANGATQGVLVGVDVRRAARNQGEFAVLPPKSMLTALSVQ